MSRTPSGPKMLMKPVPKRSGLQGNGRLRGRKGSHLRRHLASAISFPHKYSHCFAAPQAFQIKGVGYADKRLKNLI